MPACPPLDRANLDYWKRRFSLIGPGSARRFGKLEPAAMFRHLRRAIEPVLGEYHPPDVSNLLTRSSLFHALFLRLPWPKGKVVAPEWITPPAEGDLDHERDALFAAMERFVLLLEKNPAAITRNALLGDVTLDYTARLQGRHLNHHAEQFGA